MSKNNQKLFKQKFLSSEVDDSIKFINTQNSSTLIDDIKYFLKQFINFIFNIVKKI